MVPGQARITIGQEKGMDFLPQLTDARLPARSEGLHRSSNTSLNGLSLSVYVPRQAAALPNWTLQ
ncbi:hypothetical protein KTAU_21060 [Thermogemmatispora aurantia]|uniref:Uncharacterized protein n=1 Tax=Thermogemmatispora aurantia TaxID=2045279 RepID=A0A5J4K9Q5_9CHLR|nr:hypothetical protein KTAU_21060 [Thermogemmatispora aurantia]